MASEAIIIAEMQMRPRHYEGIAIKHNMTMAQLNELKQKAIADGRWTEIMMQNRKK